MQDFSTRAGLLPRDHPATPASTLRVTPASTLSATPASTLRITPPHSLLTPVPGPQLSAP